MEAWMLSILVLLGQLLEKQPLNFSFILLVKMKKRKALVTPCPESPIP